MADRVIRFSQLIFKIFSVVFLFLTLAFFISLVFFPAESGTIGVLTKWGVSLVVLGAGIVYSLFLYCFSEGLGILLELRDRERSKLK